MNPTGQGHSKKASQGAHQEAYGLARMPHDERGFGIRIRFLVKSLDRRHFLASLSYLDPVTDDQ